MTGASMSQNHHTATAPAEAQSRLCCDVTAAKSNAWILGWPEPVWFYMFMWAEMNINIHDGFK